MTAHWQEQGYWRAALAKADRARAEARLMRVGDSILNWMALVLQKTANGRGANWRWLFGAILGCIWIVFAVLAIWDPAPLKPVAPNEPGVVLTAPEQRQPLLALEDDHFAVQFARGVCLLAHGKPCTDKAADRRYELSQGAWTLLGFLTILFSFWKFVVGALARMLLRLARNHAVVTGDSAEAEALARGLATLPGWRARATVLVRRHATPPELDALGADGVFLIAGDPTNKRVLRAARVKAAGRVIAMSGSVAENVAVAAAADAQRPGKMSTRVEMPAMRLALPSKSRIRAADFLSLSDLAGRALVNTPSFLSEVHANSSPQPHIVLVGFDNAGMAVAAWALRQFWFLGKGEPLVTVFVTDRQKAIDQFRANYPAAYAPEPGTSDPPALAPGPWKAGIAFRSFSDADRSNPWPVFAAAEARAPISAIVVSAGDDHETLSIALLLARSAPAQGRKPLVAVREGAISSLSNALDALPGDDDVLQSGGLRFMSFGLANGGGAAQVLDDEDRDQAAREVHNDYIATTVLNTLKADAAEGLIESLKSGARAKAREQAASLPQSANQDERADHVLKLAQAAVAAAFDRKTASKIEQRVARALIKKNLFVANPGRPAQIEWNDLTETFIEANRAAADHAVVKMLDMGWRPRMGPRKRADERAFNAPETLGEAHANVEHARWMAERTLSGWRYGPERNDFDSVTPRLVPLSELSSLDVEYDLNNWRKANLIAAIAHPEGFEPLS